MSSKITTLSAEKREGVGKGAARSVRRAGMVPGVIYGDKKAPISISMNPKDINKELNQKGFWTRQFEIDLGKEKIKTLCQDVQFHPVSDKPVHIDFLRIAKDSIITVDVPVRFINEEICVGIKRGGVLNIVRRSVEVHCKVDDIPVDFVFDLNGLAIGDSLKISSIELPKGVKPTIERDFTIATIAAPTTVKEDSDAAEEGEEDSVAEAPKKKKEE